ncbi:MAG: hypothetical protein GY913_03230 [Proteobacteria bacterium]|nr:hypothetical protein [Pseudomonadota bacterium]MCP4915913.1 hypothetical protein [Pseudomonadota bacterium]
MDLRFRFSCPLTWDDLSGSGDGRDCSACGRRVPDVSAMTTAEARRFLAAQGGPVCIRVRVDPFGRMLTRNGAILLAASSVLTLGTVEPQLEALADAAEQVEDALFPPPLYFMGTIL